MKIVPCIHPGKKTFNLVEIEGKAVLFLDCEFCDQLVNGVKE